MTRRDTNMMLGVGLAAGLFGAGLAFLIAPRSGREMRKKINDSARDMQKQSQAEMDSAKQRLDESMDSARDMTSRLSEAIKRRAGKTQDISKQLPPTSSWNEEV